MTKIFGLLLSVINPLHILSFSLWSGIFVYLLYIIYMLGSAPGVTLKKLIIFAPFPTSFIQILQLLLSLLPPLSTSRISFSLSLHPSTLLSFQFASILLLLFLFFCGRVVKFRKHLHLFPIIKIMERTIIKDFPTM